MIRKYLEQNILITDGAMGTYYSEVTGDTKSYCEFANIHRPEIIKSIHKNYINAGAKLLRTNTFSANSITLNIKREEVRALLTQGYKIALQAAEGEDVFVGASIGPINEAILNPITNFDILAEYKFVVDTFLQLGTTIFIFETFSSLDYLKDISEYIKGKNADAFIITQFAISPDGFTRSGISINRIASEVKMLKDIDIYGFNCGSGPTHLCKLIKNLDTELNNISVLPNAGYPEIINERTVYVNNPEYFADKMMELKDYSVRIIGGCCGTNPAHIKALSESLKKTQFPGQITITTNEITAVIKNTQNNSFINKLNNNEFVVAIEVAPPVNTSVDQIMYAARLCKEYGVDLVTVPDSPMSKLRVDSIMIASKIKREIGIDAMPHICCRDKNINAIRSGMLGAHIEGIRNILAITGDPVSSTDKIGTKNVFNLNSFKLVELINEMNKDFFAKEEMQIGGALNLNVLNKDLEVNRMLKKHEKGAKFFLTQPIYDEKTIEFLSKLKKDDNIKILGGIMPIVTYRNALFLNNELPGVNIPQEYIDRFNIDMSKEEAEEIGINLAVELALKIKPYVDGFYLLTPFNRIEMMMKILRKVK